MGKHATSNIPVITQQASGGCTLAILCCLSVCKVQVLTSNKGMNSYSFAVVSIGPFEVLYLLYTFLCCRLLCIQGFHSLSFIPQLALHTGLFLADALAAKCAEIIECIQQSCSISLNIPHSVIGAQRVQCSLCQLCSSLYFLLHLITSLFNMIKCCFIKWSITQRGSSWQQISFLLNLVYFLLPSKNCS